MGTLYIGVTGNLADRLRSHRSDTGAGFTGRYRVLRLVYVERFETMPEAILREKRLKEWRRAWKIQLIETSNPRWEELMPG